MFNKRKSINFENINIGFAYNTEFGDLQIDFQKGINNNKEGFLLQKRINGEINSPDIQIIKGWHDNAHNLFVHFLND